MVYFLLLPVFVLWLVVGFIVVVACHWLSPGSLLTRVVGGVVFWASIGFIVANMLFGTLVWLGLSVGAEESDVGRVFWGLFAVVAQAIASALGFIVGALGGAMAGWRRHQRLTDGVSLVRG